MKTHTSALIFIFVCFCCLFRPSQADDFKLGPAYPANRVSRPDLPLGSFIKQRIHVTDWTLVVLLRDEKHYILNDKANRELLSKPPVQGDMVLTEQAASSFLGWRSLNPKTEFAEFWKSHPQLLEKAVQCTSSASKSFHLASGTAASDPLESQPDQFSTLPPQSAHPASAKKALDTKPTVATPTEEPASSTPWRMIVVLSVAAIGLLWLLLKRRS